MAILPPRGAQLRSALTRMPSAANAGKVGYKPPVSPSRVAPPGALSGMGGGGNMNMPATRQPVQQSMPRLRDPRNINDMSPEEVMDQNIRVNKLPVGMAYAGGNPNFDERTGQFMAQVQPFPNVQQPPMPQAFPGGQTSYGKPQMSFPAQPGQMAAPGQMNPMMQPGIMSGPNVGPIPTQPMPGMPPRGYGG